MENLKLHVLGDPLEEVCFILQFFRSFLIALRWDVWGSYALPHSMRFLSF